MLWCSPPGQRSLMCQSHFVAFEEKRRLKILCARSRTAPASLSRRPTNVVGRSGRSLVAAQWDTAFTCSPGDLSVGVWLFNFLFLPPFSSTYLYKPALTHTRHARPERHPSTSSRRLHSSYHCCSVLLLLALSVPSFPPGFDLNRTLRPVSTRCHFCV